MGVPNRPTRTSSPHRQEAAQLTELLRNRRGELGLSQQELAVRAGLSIGTVRAIESGRTIDPGLFTIIKVVDALQLDLQSIVDRMRAVGRRPA
ncbi:MAG: helix-turn-helix domain-containing protein [Pseudonocardiaceae bacterium]